jgi:hypothetical protein
VADRVVMFAGPTLAAGAVPPHVELRPPAARGDVGALLAGRAPRVIVLVDGYFQQRLAVGHAELRDALAAGATVWGLSSIGAIRAREMAPLGMRGFGTVYAMFRGPVDLQDDEVALLHEPDPPYRALSEPMVHLRAALAALAAAGHLTHRQHQHLTTTMKQRWFGDRTTDALGRELRAVLPPERHATVDAALADFAAFRLKSHDLKGFLALHPAQLTGQIPVPAATPPAWWRDGQSP